jgi:dihydroorotate dehydrogenase (fumarate)
VLPHLLERDIVSELHFTFEPYANKRTDSRGCSNYRRCITVCSYSARTLDCPDMHVDPTLCRDCGVCTDVCPTGALRAEILPQTDDAKLRETK